MKKDSSIKTYARLLKYILPYWFVFVLAIIANIAYSSIDAWFVYFLKPLLDKGFIQKDAEFIKWLPIIIVSVFLGRAVANIASNYFMTRVSRSVVMVIRQKLFRYYQHMSATLYDTSSTGNLLSVLIYNVQQLANASADALTMFLQALILVIGLLVVMFHISWKLTIIYFVTMPLIVLVVAVSSNRTRRLSKSIQNSMADITSIAEENIDGYKVVRTFGGKDYEVNRFDRATKDNRHRELKVAMTRAYSMSGVQVLAATALAIIVYLASSGSGLVQLSAGGFTSFVSAMLAILKPMKDLTNVNTKIQRGLAAAQAVFEVMDGSVENDAGSIPLKKASGAICFDDVNFAYDTSDKNVLQAINLRVEPGEIVALVGRSGSGKSTLLNLLLRFYQLQEGEIRLDDVAVQNYQLEAYRSQFAYVSQHVVLFNDTVANNIAYGSDREQLSREDIINAAKAANAYDFIMKLPEGFDSVVGEDGVLLSGGQRQRLAIARAIIKQVPILLMDEATSALDTESERLIQEALNELMSHRTTIVIAHRLSTITRADKIVVFDHGEIVESGRHEELLAKEGAYFKLHQMQFRDE